MVAAPFAGTLSGLLRVRAVPLWGAGPWANWRSAAPSPRASIRDHHDRGLGSLQHRGCDLAEIKRGSRPTVCAHDDEIAIVLSRGQDRLVWIDVSAHDGLRLGTVATRQSQEILQDRALARASGATVSATLFPRGFGGGRGMDRGDR